jgi:beta-mannosidase
LEETFNEWRRVGSTCRGALVWQWQDVTPGAGWGMMDSLGRRKPVWYALQRACRTRQLILTDEGLNGLAVHILNEADQPLDAILRLDCLSEAGAPVRQAEHAVTLPPRAATRLDTSALMPGFFDITYAYRFGPPVHDVTVASLYDCATGTLLADACHFPDIAALKIRDVGMTVSIGQDAQGWSLRLLPQRFAQFVHIDDQAFTAAENWLHLAPGRERRIRLLSPADPAAIPRGEVRALNMDRVIQYTGRQ